jgi:DNA-binding response OmpR family regulator/tetratricopeptide (TPR) repeat protein
MAITILVVEDDPHVRSILESVFARDPAFRQLEPRVVLATNGEEGLALFDRERPQLVVSDLMMPKLDGFSLCRAIRERANAADVAILVTSAVWTDPGVTARLREELQVEFFAKPFQIRELCDAALRLLAARERRILARDAARAAARVLDAATVQLPPQGSLAERTLACLLLDAHESRASGLLALRRGKIEKDVVLMLGHPVSVESNIRTETLGHILITRGVLSADQYDAALERARSSKNKLGATLIEMGILSEHEVIRYLTAQVKVKLVSALRWNDGEFTFDPNPDAGDRVTRYEVDPAPLVFTGLRRSARPDQLLDTLAPKRDAAMVATPRLQTYKEPFRKVFGRGALAAVGSRSLLGDLLEESSSPSDLAVAIDALLLTGMVELQEMTTTQVRRSALRTAVDPRALGAPSTGQTVVAPAKPLLPERPRLRQAALHDSDQVPDVIPPSALAVTADITAADLVASEPELPLWDELLPEIDLDSTDPRSNASLYEELFGSRGENITPIPTLVDPSIVRSPDEESFKLGAHLLLPPDEADDEVEGLRRGILAQYLRLDTADHYSLLGVDREADGDAIADAYQAAVERLGLGRIAGRDLGADYAKFETVNEALRQARDVLLDPRRRADYDRSLEPTPVSIYGEEDRKVEAELRFREGEAAMRDGDIGTAFARFTAAVELNPGEADYRSHLGWATYQVQGTTQEAARAARQELRQALAIESRHPAAHDYLGRIAVDLGDEDDAITHFELALDADPTWIEALAFLEDLLKRRNELRRLEKLFCQTLSRLGKRDVELQVRLWWNLAELYRTRLHDVASARGAFEEAARLAPREVRLQEALAAIYANDPERWPDAVRALRACWKLAPKEPKAGRNLFQLHRNAGRTDAALVVAGALVVRGAADPEVNGFLAEHRPRFLMRTAGRLALPARGRLRHADEDPLLNELLGLLADIGRQVHPVTLGDLGLRESDRVGPAEVPLSFSRLMEYAANVVGVAPPPLFVREDLREEIAVGSVGTPILLCGTEALRTEDKTSLAFRLGRTLSLLEPGRLEASTLQVSTLRGLIKGASASSLREYSDDGDPMGEAETTRTLLLSGPAAIRMQAQALLERIDAERGSINLARYVRGVARTAERVGLVLCNDIVVAARLCDHGAAQAEESLIDFALSTDYLEIREELGLHVGRSGVTPVMGLTAVSVPGPSVTGPHTTPASVTTVTGPPSGVARNPLGRR